MVTTRTSASSSAASSPSFAQQGGHMLAKLKGVGTMSWVLLAIVTLYIALVNPSNTPSFFSNSVFKFGLFAFVVVVYVLEGPLIGTLFAIAMTIPVIYSSMREGYANPFIENYADTEDEAASPDADADADADEENADTNSIHMGVADQATGVATDHSTDHSTDHATAGVASDAATVAATDASSSSSSSSPAVTEAWCNYARY
jgi:hypothetical protein